jgi:alanyl-tRNA synthetase
MTIACLPQLREQFISFMRERGYLRIKADYLISDAFPTTFNVSGGPNFVDHYLDEGKQEGGNSVTIQHCLRHWDYENAGDGSHLSFFEMGVTTAFDGYPQRRVFHDHLSFILDHLGFPKESLYITVFGGGSVRGAHFDKDKETEETWLSLGISDENIYLIPQEVPEEIAARVRAERGADVLEREAFVSNAVEPVGGPRTEIFIDRGGRGRCEPCCIPGFCTCGRFVEFWTSVHYTVRVTPVASERNRQGEMALVFEPLQLNSRIYAAAFGLERVMQIMLNQSTIYDFEPLSGISALITPRLKGQRSSDEKKHVWAIADHLRGLTFLILEGVQGLSGKNNRSRKYEYRRYIKSLHSHYEALGLPCEAALVKQLVEKVIASHIEHLPYREIYDRRSIDTEAITREIITRMENINAKPELV